MIDPFSAVQVVLQEAGYGTWLASLGQRPAICFEDEAAFGFVGIFQDASVLIDRWRNAEGSFLEHYADSIRAAGDKAWNVYSVFLCSGPADEIQRRQVRWVEEDLERTRKIAACGLTTREDVSAALLPLLPLQHRPALENEDITERLRKRIAAIAPSVSSVALDDAVPPVEVVRLLGGYR